MKPNLDKINRVILNDYLIQETLGKGTFGKVKLGLSLTTQEKVAIKILERRKILDEDDLNRVRRELSILKRFGHQNVIQVRDIVEDSERFYIIMEYCEGGELFNYIVKKKRLTEEEASYFFYQIINGVEHIHSYNVVHRDLKPENLLFGKDYILKIIDFGLSNYFNQDGSSELLSTPCGSPCYASPEMVSGRKYNGCKIDVWSIGIILYAMLCGYLPFEDQDNDILFQKILQCDLSFPNHISSLSKDIIRKILVTDPEQRITISEIKKHQFYLEGKTYFTIKHSNFENVKYSLKTKDLESASLEESETFDLRRTNPNQSKRGTSESWHSPVKSSKNNRIYIDMNHPNLCENSRLSTEPNRKRVSDFNNLFRYTGKNIHMRTAVSPEYKIDQDQDNFYDPLKTEGNEQVLATHTIQKAKGKLTTNKKAISLSKSPALNSRFLEINSVRLTNIVANDYILNSPVKSKQINIMRKKQPIMISKGKGISTTIVERNPQGIHFGKVGNARIPSDHDKQVRYKPHITSKNKDSISFNSYVLNFTTILPQETVNTNISREHKNNMKVYDINFPKSTQRHDVTPPTINLQVNLSRLTNHKNLPSPTKKNSNESYSHTYNNKFFNNLDHHQKQVIHLNTDGNEHRNKKVNIMKVSDHLKKGKGSKFLNTISSNKATSNEKSKMFKSTLNSIKELVKKIYYKDVFSNLGNK